MIDEDARKLAMAAARAADEAHATDIVVLHVGEVLAVTEYFVIATGLLAQSDIMADDAFKLLAVDENGTTAFIAQDGPDAGSAMLRAVHASPDAPAVAGGGSGPKPRLKWFL